MKKIVMLMFLLLLMTGCSYNTTTKDVYQIDDQVTEIVSKVEDSTVMIVTKFNSRSLALGSGVIYNKRESSYYVLTNAHVVSSGNKFEVVLNSKDAKILGTSLGIGAAIESEIYTITVE